MLSEHFQTVKTLRLLWVRYTVHSREFSENKASHSFSFSITQMFTLAEVRLKELESLCSLRAANESKAPAYCGLRCSQSVCVSETTHGCHAAVRAVSRCFPQRVCMWTLRSPRPRSLAVSVMSTVGKAPAGQDPDPVVITAADPCASPRGWRSSLYDWTHCKLAATGTRGHRLIRSLADLSGMQRSFTYTEPQDNCAQKKG